MILQFQLNQLRKKITKKTKAIIPVHLNGRCTNLDELQEICNKFSLTLIEDAAQALGSKYKKKILGSIGDVNAFSFSPPKIITTGQGGIVTTNDSRIYDKLRSLKDQGRYDKSDNHPMVGYNFKFTDIQAALGNSQFSKLKKRLTHLKKIFTLYDELIHQNRSITIPPRKPETQLWYFDILTKKRAKLFEFLKNSKIMTRKFYRPLNVHKPFRTKEFPISSKISSVGLYLPSSSDLTSEDVQLISNKINSFFKEA